MQQKVLPIKDSNVLRDVQRCLKEDFKAGVRNYTIFQVGKATMLRVSDVLSLKMSDVFEGDHIRKNAYIIDKKTGKPNTIYLAPVENDLLVYHSWLQSNNLESEWLFPSTTHPERHIRETQYYKVMAKVGDLLGIDYLGTHTMRKTGAYKVYTQTGHNIGLVMDLLNHSSEKMTLAYLGLDQVAREKALDMIDFG